MEYINASLIITSFLKCSAVNVSQDTTLAKKSSKVVQDAGNSLEPEQDLDNLDDIAYHHNLPNAHMRIKIFGLFRHYIIITRNLIVD